jgi:hypothetical protein
VDVKRQRKKAEDRPVWVVILQVALIILKGPYVKDEDEVQ